MKQRRDKLFSFYADLSSQVDSAMKLCLRYLFLIAATGLITLPVIILRPKFDYLMTLLLALSAIPAAGFSIYTALSTLRNLGGAFRDGVIMVDEFRHELHVFRDSDAGREIASKSPLGELEILPDFTRLTKISHLELWFSAVGAVAMFVTAVYPFLSY